MNFLWKSRIDVNFHWLWRYTYFLMLYPVIKKLNNFIKLLIMVMVKITTLENFSISSKFARENLYYSYFYHHHHHCLLRKAMETGKFFSCLCVCVSNLWNGWDYWCSSWRLKCTQQYFVVHWYSMVFSIFLL